jgi:hypothetical protein
VGLKSFNLFFFLLFPSWWFYRHFNSLI